MNANTKILTTLITSFLLHLMAIGYLYMSNGYSQFLMNNNQLFNNVLVDSIDVEVYDSGLKQSAQSISKKNNISKTLLPNTFSTGGSKLKVAEIYKPFEKSDMQTGESSKQVDDDFEYQNSSIINSYSRSTPLEKSATWVSMDLLLHQVPPRYPTESVEREEQGLVVVLVRVNRRGKVTTALIKKSSGYPSLDQSALESIIQWVFVTKVENSDREFLVPVEFNLEG